MLYFLSCKQLKKIITTIDEKNGENRIHKFVANYDDQKKNDVAKTATTELFTNKKTILEMISVVRRLE